MGLGATRVIKHWLKTWLHSMKDYSTQRPIENKILPELEDFLMHPIKWLMSPRSHINTQFLMDFHDLMIEHHSEKPNLIEIDEKDSYFNDVLIVGDTHGNILSTLRIIKPFFENKIQSIIFLGDYVDRGHHSLLNFILVGALTLAWPKRVIMLRGNHEDPEINLRFGFFKELCDLFDSIRVGQDMLLLMDEIYSVLPIAAITPKRSFCIHAGIPKSIPIVKDLLDIPKPHDLLANIPDDTRRKHLYEIFFEFLWNDPTENPELAQNGISYHGMSYFSEKEVDLFLKKNKLKRIIRAHESLRGSFDLLFDGKLIHIFSTEPYYGHIKQAFTIHETKTGETWLNTLDFERVKPIISSQQDITLVEDKSYNSI